MEDLFWARFKTDLAVPAEYEAKGLHPPTEDEMAIYLLLDNGAVDFWEFLAAHRELKHTSASVLVRNTCKNYPPKLYNMFDSRGKFKLEPAKLEQYGKFDKWKDTGCTLEYVINHNKSCTEFMTRAHTVLLGNPPPAAKQDPRRPMRADS
jgi:hypothetical protein